MNDVIVDPVCGIELEKNLAISYKFKNDKVYYFCCDGCRKIFIRKPKKWIKRSDRK